MGLMGSIKAYFSYKKLEASRNPPVPMLLVFVGWQRLA